MRRFLILACAAAVSGLVATGCGSDPPPETLTCEWLAGPDNCLVPLATAAAACVPPNAEEGTLSADYSTCTYPSGSTITFSPPLMIPVPEFPEWNFVVPDANGSTCVQYQDSQTATTLTVGTQTVRFGSSGFGISLTCPDGTTVRTQNALNLFSCPGGFLNLPGLYKSWDNVDNSWVSAGISSGGANSVRVFICNVP